MKIIKTGLPVHSHKYLTWNDAMTYAYWKSVADKPKDATASPTLRK